ncbi:hypothetical protein CSKR_110445 [Clonorchis sinensis]|uniref:Uncharacterized protein n=1 Tax=Clonorchis sinensis TaxID=79923 RepID=A0A3R7JT67_CLOSI|nr:hypothetical protein CSKR_110445 [Clonorchis sinensis]
MNPKKGETGRGQNSTFQMKSKDILEEFGKQSVDLLLGNVSPLTQKLRQAKRATECAALGRLMFQLLRYSRYRDTGIYVMHFRPSWGSSGRRSLRVSVNLMFYLSSALHVYMYRDISNILATGT